jgi:hypothetical protein
MAAIPKKVKSFIKEAIDNLSSIAGIKVLLKE